MEVYSPAIALSIAPTSMFRPPNNHKKFCGIGIRPQYKPRLIATVASCADAKLFIRHLSSAGGCFLSITERRIAGVPLREALRVPS